MRKLTVKNFSVIKEAELEFGKITVLIGPQSSGKSLLCKLAFFFAQIVPEVATGTLLLRMPFKQFSETIRDSFLERFPAEAWSGESFQISYTADSNSISVHGGDVGVQVAIRFDEDFINEYEGWIESHREEGSAKHITSSVGNGNLLSGFPAQLGGATYIPTGRAFFSTPNKGFASISGKNLDWMTKLFSTVMDFNYRSLIKSSETDQALLAEFGVESAAILGGRVILWDGIPHFQMKSSTRRLPFDLLSSGTLELLPLLNPLSGIVSSAKFSKHFEAPERSQPSNLIFVEEPESSVFPKTQFHLVRLFAWISNQAVFNLSFAITTHSPYLLSSFNVLIKAGEAARKRPEKAAEIESTVPRKYWIDASDFAAYAFNGSDGILRPMIDSDTGLIDGDTLDDVSSTIGREFEELLEIQYGS